MQLLQPAIKICALPSAHRNPWFATRKPQYLGIQPYLRPTIVGRTPPPRQPRITMPTPHYPLVGTNLQVCRGRWFLQACNGLMTPHAAMYHPTRLAILSCIAGLLDVYTFDRWTAI